METESEDEEVSRAVCVCLVNALDGCVVYRPPPLHFCMLQIIKKKTGRWEGLGMRLRCLSILHLFCVQEFPPVQITDKTGKVLDEKCKI